MRFYNKKTGITLDLPLQNPGGDWALVTDLQSEKAEESQNKKAEEEKPETTKRQSGITKKEIQQELDAFGIDYDPKAKKDDLYKLMKERLNGEHNC